MALSPKLEMRHGQQLVMTPQLQQAIRLLQLSNMELSAFVETELERNPLLDRSEDGPEIPEIRTTDTADEDRAPQVDADATDRWLDNSTSLGERSKELDTDVENVFPDAGSSDLAGSAAPGGDLGSWSSVRQTSNAGDDPADLEEYLSSETSLRGHLTDQMQLAFADPIERLIAHNLIDLVDDAGYLTLDIEQMAERLGAPRALIDGVLAKLQKFDPPGVFARSLAECLTLQLKDRNRYDPQIACLLENLQLLANHNLSALRRAVGVDLDELTEMIAELKQLDPKPGLRFGTIRIQTVVPDVHVRTAGHGGWAVELNTDTLPRVLINRTYYAHVSKTVASPRDREYLHDCLQTANWLVKSLDQRARTILRVAEEIVRQQDGFFSYGVQHLRPLNLKTVADAVKMHESTVSRVTSNKYMATPRGVFELKYFFTSAIASAGDGEAHSSEAVRYRIKQLIDGERPAAVLSDDRIVELLHGEGIDIARRTVAKYREAMRIPSSVQRRREKRMADRTAKVEG